MIRTVITPCSNWFALSGAQIFVISIVDRGVGFWSPCALMTANERRQRERSRQRARGEHAFRVIKTLWGFTKVRYRALHKNLVRAYAMFALANLYLVRRRLMPRGAMPSLT